MTITSLNSVLIVGAGASADFGLPLGGPLLSEVREELSFQAKAMKEARFPQANSNQTIIFSKSPKLERTGIENKDFPIWIWLRDNNKKIEGESHIYEGDGLYFNRLASMMTDVADLLDEQTSETIDDFIAMNPESAEIVKLAIACVFYRLIFSTSGKSQRSMRKPLHTRELLHKSANSKKHLRRRNWVHLLINIVRHAAYNKGLQHGQKIRIISFNYDGILESILDSQFGNTGHKFKPWSEYIQIIHPHGWMGDIPEACDNMKTTIEEWALAINVVNELELNDYVKTARETAQDWISNADEVYMAGFALSTPNAKMLGLGPKQNKKRQHWQIHNYDGSAGLKYIARSYEDKPPNLSGNRSTSLSAPSSVIKVSFEGGTSDNPMTIANWFQIGVPGDMPG